VEPLSQLGSELELKTIDMAETTKRKKGTDQGPQVRVGKKNLGDAHIAALVQNGVVARSHLGTKYVSRQRKGPNKGSTIEERLGKKEALWGEPTGGQRPLAIRNSEKPKNVGEPYVWSKTP